ncbi:hypothetical protein ACTI_85420 [Actinoplanes sp. OR16]|uniref:hypothetical protein n=1 Tax=Actinoplanes sp. OR16 TaxID=946334 RepID=UPI000F6D9C01|nr:hypothetical protein [Actinoplanes sp. OR16]BBH71857.1 hypothetical protein ACTI_85420 [Actinoplanes sp. OR16]
MKPRQIAVFDGLRITTEHLDHLQAAFLTGLDDLREATGAVRRGFEVRADGADQVVVEPGLAFDLDGNRVVCEEPRTLGVVFPEGGAPLWVTVTYDQPQSGETEGRNTLVWDDCEFDLRPVAPGPADRAIVLARLERGTDGALVVHPQLGSPQAAQPPPVFAPAEPAGERLCAAQGVLRIGGPPDGNGLVLLAAALADPSADPSDEPCVTLATADVGIPFRLVSLSSQSVLTATVTADGDGSPPVLRAVAWGEAAPAGALLAQHALTTGGPAPVLTEGAVAELPLSEWAGTAPIFARLRARVEVRRADSGDLRFAVTVDWTAGPGEEPLHLLESTSYRLHLGAEIAWKALGCTGRPHHHEGDESWQL